MKNVFDQSDSESEEEIPIVNIQKTVVVIEAPIIN